ncbi:MAG TPA: DUF4097 family beta strand repeat-containing protein [Bryobacteraceae bacterium]|jgi:DUF4097 and DUF4098 domain-containing protein YvlB|nr:DUF4097 family beta strand repeat-containing protein [Bryobacteraceae bacterium]
MSRFIVPATCLVVACAASFAVGQEKTLTCDDQNRASRDRGSFCEIRETTMPASGQLDIDGGVNGGVSVKGWSHPDILVRSRVQTNAEDDGDARRLASGIRVNASGSRISAEGPTDAGHERGWGVSFEVFVPSRTDVSIKTHNGGIRIAGVNGRIRFDAVNGGVRLTRLSGDVEGRTTNGGLHLELAGARWDGAKCDVSTTNGGVKILVPSNYSAHLEAGTTNGGMRVGFPVTVHGELNHRLSVDLGQGGALVRAVTTNGGVSIEQSSVGTT